MTDDRAVLGLGQCQAMDNCFSFGSLNAALNELDFLNTEVTVPTKDQLNGLKICPGARHTSNLNTLYHRRHISQPPQVARNFTKENVGNPVLSPNPYYHDSMGRVASKALQSQAHRARVCPYFRRKPLYSVRRSSSLHHVNSPSNRTNGYTNPESDCYLRSLRSVNSIPRLLDAEGRGRLQIEPINFQPSSFLFDDGLNRKTEDYCSYPFPVPVLTRSKSLEDLRESVKPKLKSLSTDITSGSSISSFDAASLSPRRSFPRSRQNPLPTLLGPRRILENAFSSEPFDSRIISSKDVDSMSILIENLDVA